MEFNYKEWQNPDVKYRGKPFWALNGKLNKKELKKQAAMFKKMGFGGAFFHSRTGLITEYMSKEWLKDIKYCVKEFKKNGLEAWLYDEDRYSSGSCGGKVTENKDFREKSMVYDEVFTADYKVPETFIAFFAVKFDEESKRVVAYRKVGSFTDKTQDERVFCFYYIFMRDEDFYNGNAYVDTMNKDATELFLKLTHEKYKKVIGDKFGKEVIGIFTDEPHRGPYLSTFSRDNEPKKDVLIPYTFCLFSEFKKRCGYDIVDHLPILWFGKKDREFSKEAYDLIEVMQQLFLENFAKPYAEWCKNNKLIFTGHVLHEDNLVAQTAMCGSVMRFMEYFDYPGIDNLGSENYAFTVPAMVSSVAKQLGKKFVVDELYGVTGWQTTFADYKRIGDWQSVGGITFRCPHHSWYTMKGEAKRDYPASIFYQSAWWEDFSYIENYFSRLQYIVANGTDTVDTAIINPIESTWGLVDERSHNDYFQTDNPLYKKIQENYLELFEKLHLFGARVDYIDEGILCGHGDCKNGQLICGLKKYRKIILNGNLNLRSSTVKLLKRFSDDGGKILVVGDIPKYCDANPFDFIGQVKGAKVLPFDPLKVMSEINDEKIQTGSDKIICTEKVFDSQTAIIFLNVSKEKAVSKIKIKTNKKFVKLNARNGEKEGINFTREGDFVIINKTFYPDEELILLFGQENIAATEVFCCDKENIEEFLFKLCEPNLLPLYNCECFIDGEYFYSGDVLEIDRRLRDKFNLKPRHDYMMQPWYRNKYCQNQNKKFGRITLKFNVDSMAELNNISVICEDYENAEMIFNGVNIKLKGKPYTLDCSLSAFPIKNVLKKGENELMFSFDFYERTDIEALYLSGEFGVYGGRLGLLPEILQIGDFTTQGLEYYGGKINLYVPAQEGEYIAQFDNLNCAFIKVNDSILAFPPYLERIKVKEGLSVQIAFTRINTFGFEECGKWKHDIFQQGITSFSISKIKSNTNADMYGKPYCPNKDNG